MDNEGHGINSVHVAIGGICFVTGVAIYAGTDLASLSGFYAAIGAFAAVRQAIKSGLKR